MVAVALAIRDPRVPWHARALGALIVAYALSPIDLIPDFVPVTGYLDDLVLVPLGLILMLRFSKYRGGSGWRRHEISRWNAPMSTNAAGSPITLLFPDFRSVPRLNVSFSFARYGVSLLAAQNPNGRYRCQRNPSARAPDLGRAPHGAACCRPAWRSVRWH